MKTIPKWWSVSGALLWGAGLALVALSVLLVVTRAPVEQQMGVAQKIFYIHVPSAIVTVVAFGLTFAASIAYLATRSWAWDAVAVASCEVGMIFATVVLVTGPLWARSSWNTWWTWEPRLTSFLVMWILYGGYHIVRHSVASGARRTVSAVLGIVLIVTYPITLMSVHWWRGSLHPKNVVMTPEMRGVLLVSMIAWFVFYAAALQQRLRIEALREGAAEDTR